ncbi:MAG TPA: prolyl oligopeptidase family serine peptidase [Gemmatimonadales bacterium]|nr:prolyl oligopeptidase family serine peptidase [Gemmatimonadales bacterium]
MRRLCLAILTLAAPVAAQEPYRDPPPPISRILDAPPLPFASLSPDRGTLLLLERNALPPIADIAAPELRLAGLRIDPRTFGPARSTPLRGFRAVRVGGGTEQRIATPAGARLGSPQWSRDSRRLAFTVEEQDGIALWVAEVATGEAHRVTPRRLNETLGRACGWMPSGTALLCRLVPEGLAGPPAEAAPTGPAVLETRGRTAANRTYQDLLRNAADEARYEYYTTSQLALVDLDGTVHPIGEPAIWSSAEPSPDGRWLLVERRHRPWSYVVPVGRFPRTVEILAVDGRSVRTLADLPLQDDVPTDFDAVAPGLRRAGWQQGTAATVVWAEALDGGDARREAPLRDRVLALPAPFAGEPGTVVELGYRLDGFAWLSDGRAIVTESWWKTRRTRTWLVGDGAPPRLLFDRSSEDRYGDPGAFVTAEGPLGRTVLTSSGGRFAYLEGPGASPEGDRPFLDRFEIATGRTSRLFHSMAPHYEEVMAPLDPEARRALTRRESVDEAPNYFVRDLRTRRLAQLTRFEDPAPEFAGLEPELVHYTRADGVALSARLYLPPGYDRSRGPLPFLFWAYPTEYKSAAAAAQVSGSPYRFVRPAGTSHLFLLTQGYGILDDPTMPIVGEGGAEPNDTYLEQLVASAQAAVEKVVAMGVADRARIAIGGHSYGAFMTANLLAHSDLFRTGIARSGAYNRTLTPFGFQSEERSWWEAPETYTRMSPFTYANRVNEPLLLIHGEADNNAGTFPIQSERMFAAMQGSGGTARLVLLPAESHGYAARESVGHVLWEMTTWLDRWVKGAGGVTP